MFFAVGSRERRILDILKERSKELNIQLNSTILTLVDFPSSFLELVYVLEFSFFFGSRMTGQSHDMGLYY